MGMIIQNGKQYFPVYNDTEIKALPTVDTASGSIATFNTDLTENLVSVKCQIVAKQASGTPSPVNPLPIGVYDSLTLYHNDINMWDEQWEVYGSGASARIGSKNPIPCIGGRTYYLTSTPAYGWKFYDIEGNVILTYYNKTCTAPNNAVYMMFQLDDTYGTVYNHDVSLNYPATDTDYHAFNGAYIPFGQTVANGVIDITTGKLVITWGYIDLGTLTWGTVSADNTSAIANNPIGAKVPSNNAEVLHAICDSYNVVSRNNLANLVICMNFGGTLIIKNDNFAGYSAPQVKSALSGVYMAYELNSPQTVQLDSITLQALLNENNIWCDTGDTEVKFLLTVGKKIA